MKYTETEAESILERLVASTRSPRGRFSAEQSYPLLKKRLTRGKRYVFGAYKIRILATAAAVALLLAMGWMVYEYMRPVEMHTISTLAECQNVKLPDGSEVTLNHYSSLTYPKRFDSKYRKVALKGEGYFEVSKSKEHPFIVQAEAVKVRVLGTHFNIEAYPGDPEVKTTLLEGSVSVSTATHPEGIVLRPNESAVYHKEKRSLTREAEKNVSDKIAWQRGAFIFDHLPLQEIARKLSHSFGVDIQIENEALRQYRLTAKFTNGESLEEILSLLQRGRNFTYKATDKGFVIN